MSEDPDLKEINRLWPKLTEQQRHDVYCLFYFRLWCSRRIIPAPATVFDVLCGAWLYYTDPIRELLNLDYENQPLVIAGVVVVVYYLLLLSI